MAIALPGRVRHDICQAFYQQARNKKQAIVDILNAKDFERLLAGSGYAQTQ